MKPAAFGKLLGIVSVAFSIMSIWLMCNGSMLTFAAWFAMAVMLNIAKSLDPS